MLHTYKPMQAPLRLLAAISVLFYLGACGTENRTSTLTFAGKSTPGLHDNVAGSPIFAMIAEAQKSIDIEIYEIGDADVRQALITAAQQRQVKVRIVIEPKPVGVSCNVVETTGEEDSNCKIRRDALRELVAGGIEVTAFSKELCGNGAKHCFQHGKLLIADNKKAMISTGNFNSSSLCNENGKPSKCNRDFTMVVEDKTAVNAFSKVFEEDRQAKPYDLAVMLTPTVRKRVSVSPHALPDITGFIARANKHVYVQAQYLKEPESNAALMAAAKRGVKVAVTLASLCSFTTRINERSQETLRKTYQPFIDAGVDLKFFTKLNEIGGRPGYMHSKLIVIDDEEFWVGSINGSTTSFLQNREFGIFSKEKNAVNTAIQVFKQDHYSEFNETLDDNLLCKKEANATKTDPDDDDLDPEIE